MHFWGGDMAGVVGMASGIVVVCLVLFGIAMHLLRWMHTLLRPFLHLEPLLLPSYFGNSSQLFLVSAILGCDCDITCHTDIVLIFHITALNI